MTTRVEKVSGYYGDRAAVQKEWQGEWPLVGMDYADDHGREPRPLLAPGRFVERAVVFADPAQTGRARVALADSVRGDQAECPLAPQKVERAAEEVGHEIGVAVRLLVDRLQPVRITGREPGRERVLARERRVTHERIEAPVNAVEDLGELDLPVKGKDRMRSTSKPADGCLEPLMARHVELAALGGEVVRQRLESLLPLPIILGREEGGDDEITVPASRVEEPVGGR